MLDAEIPPLQVLTKLGHDAGEDEILRIFLEVGDVDYVHRTVTKAPEWEIAHLAGVRDETRAPGGDVRQPVSNLADRRDVMGAPALTVFLLHPLKNVAEPGVEIGEGLNLVLLAQQRIAELPVDDLLAN